MNADSKILQQVLANSELIYDQVQIEQAIDTMAEKINRQLADSHPIVLTVLVGGVVLAGQLVTKLDFTL